MKAFEKIYKIVSKIPKGKVITYKQVSDLAKLRNPRIVGFALHRNTNTEKVPCHRVIKSDGTLAKGYAFGGKLEQKRKLKQEGVTFTNDDCVDLQKSLFTFFK